jgi:uncharacterized protein (TIGR02270 family)
MARQEYGFTELIRNQLTKDAPYTWFLFDQAKRNTRYRLPDFKEQADRAEACLDALGVALNAGEPVEEWLEMADWGSCFVLAVLGIRHNQPRLFDFALDALDESEETHPREMLDACLWSSEVDLAPWMSRMAKHQNPLAQEVLANVARSSQLFPEPKFVAYFSDDKSLGAQAHLLNWLGEEGGPEHLPFIQSHYASDSPEIVFAAARAGLLRGDEEARTYLRTFVRDHNPYTFDAVTLALLHSPDADLAHRWVDFLWQAEDVSMHAKLHAIAVAGLPEYMDKLIEAMRDAQTSRTAGEAFSILTGADLEHDDLEAADESILDQEVEAEGEDNVPTQAESYIKAWEKDLPYPCHEAVQDWWGQHGE